MAKDMTSFLNKIGEIDALYTKAILSDQDLVILENELRKQTSLSKQMMLFLIEKVISNPAIFNFAPQNLKTNEKFFITLTSPIDYEYIENQLNDIGLKTPLNYANMLRKYLASKGIDPLLILIEIILAPQGISSLRIDQKESQGNPIFSFEEIRALLTIDISRINVKIHVLKPNTIEMAFYPVEYKTEFFTRIYESAHNYYRYEEKPITEYLIERNMNLSKILDIMDQYYQYPLPKLYFITAGKFNISKTMTPSILEKRKAKTIENLTSITQKINLLCQNKELYDQCVQLFAIMNDHFDFFKQFQQNPTQYRLPIIADELK